MKSAHLKWSPSLVTISFTADIIEVTREAIFILDLSPQEFSPGEAVSVVWGKPGERG